MKHTRDARAHKRIQAAIIGLCTALEVTFAMALQRFDAERGRGDEANAIAPPFCGPL